MKTHTDSDFDIDCPWCSGPLTTTTDGHAGDAFACATCSIVVELASDPVAVTIALAA